MTDWPTSLRSHLRVGQSAACKGILQIASLAQSFTSFTTFLSICMCEKHILGFAIFFGVARDFFKISNPIMIRRLASAQLAPNENQDNNKWCSIYEPVNLNCQHQMHHSGWNAHLKFGHIIRKSHAISYPLMHCQNQSVP